MEAQAVSMFRGLPLGGQSLSGSMGKERGGRRDG